MQNAGILIVLLWVKNFTGIITENVGNFYVYWKKLVWIHLPGYGLDHKAFVTENDDYQY